MMQFIKPNVPFVILYRNEEKTLTTGMETKPCVVVLNERPGYSINNF